LQEVRPVVADTFGVDSRAAAVGFAQSAGRRVEVPDTAAGNEVVLEHKLGRVPSGWYVIDLTDGWPTYYRVSWDDRRLVLRNNGPVTVRGAVLWVW
jgi:hypothetical protein